MLNREKYAKEILDIACKGDKIAICNGKLTACEDTRCINCDFRDPSDCNEEILKWANSEYVEPIDPPVDWSKIPVDTPILVRPNEEHAWSRRYFAKYENGSVYAWEQGATSWSIDDPAYICDWKYAKLAESEESHD